MRNIAQVRIGLGYFKSKVYYHQLSLETCSFCNLEEDDTLSHFILRCRIHNGPRSIYINRYIQNIPSERKLITLLNIHDRNQCNNVYNYIQQSIKERLIIIEE
jgi:hypothetical protein